jgi:hypothetical protein
MRMSVADKAASLGYPYVVAGGHEGPDCLVWLSHFCKTPDCLDPGIFIGWSYPANCWIVEEPDSHVPAHKVPAGGKFRMGDLVYTRVTPTFPLPNYREWCAGKGPSPPSRMHVFAVHDLFNFFG